MARTNKLKKVNVNAKKHIHGTNYRTIYGLHRGLILTSSDIKKCLDGGADVYEVLSNGTTVKLDYTNYNKDNRAKPVEPAEEKAENKPADVDPPLSTNSSFIPKEAEEEETSEDIQEEEELEEDINDEEETLEEE